MSCSATFYLAVARVCSDVAGLAFLGGLGLQIKAFKLDLKPVSLLLVMSPSLALRRVTHIYSKTTQLSVSPGESTRQKSTRAQL